MLIKRTEKDGIITAVYESSNIMLSTYNTKTEMLSIVFKGAMEYFYEDVSKIDYHKFELADSQGKVFRKYFTEHKCTKGGRVDLDLLIEQVNNAKKEEVTNLEANITEVAKKLATNGVSDNTLDDMVTLINLRKEKTNKI